jgi:hypothetical protein
MNKYFACYEALHKLSKPEQRYYIWDMIKWCIKEYIKTYKK